MHSGEALTRTRRVILKIVLLGVALFIARNCVYAAETEPLAGMLRAAPTDEALFARIVELAANGEGVAPLAAYFEAAGRGNQSPSDLHLAARLAEAAGSPARALALYERAAAADGALVESSARLIALYLRASWPERAAELLRPELRLVLGPERWHELGYALAVAARDRAGARRILEVESKATAADARARWAERAGDLRAAAALWRSAGKPAAALRAALAAGALADARALFGTSGVAASDSDLLALARGCGDPEPLEARLGARDDGAARRLRSELALALGTAQRESTPDDSEADEFGYPWDISRVTHRAESAPQGSERAPAHARIALGDDPPSLKRVLSLLESGDRMAARAELARWQLEPNPAENSTLGTLKLRVPEWLRRSATFQELLAALEETRSKEEFSEELAEALDAARAAASAGSDREAILLFHAGRLRADSAMLRRAAAIAPETLVRVPHGALHVTRSIADAVRRLRGEAEPLREVLLPEPFDLVLGANASNDPLRLRSDLKSITGEWHLVSWQEMGAQPPHTLDFVLDEKTVRFGDHPVWEARALAPIHAVIRVPAAGWLAFGRGLAVIAAETGAELLRIESERPVSWDSLPLEIAEQVPPGLAAFLAMLRRPDAKEVGAPALWTFLTAAARRDGAVSPSMRDCAVSLESAYRDGDKLFVTTSNGLRATFAPGPGVLAEPLEIRGYARGKLRWHCSAAPPSFIDAGDESPQGAPPARLRRAWHYDVPLPSAARCTIEPLRAQLREESPLPAELASETIVAADGDSPRVLLTGGGYLLYYTDPRELPAWIGKFDPLLPGPKGFAPPQHDAGDPNEIRWRHVAASPFGPRTPGVKVLGTNAFIITDTVTKIESDGESRTLFAPLADERVQDLLLDAAGDLWVLTSERAFRATGRFTEWSLASEGRAVDFECAHGRIYALCYDGTGFALYERSLEDFEREASRGEMRIDLPSIDMQVDRAGLRITALGRWGDTLLLLHDKLYALQVEGGRATWRVLVEWPGHDPERHPYYVQTPPRLVASDVLIVARPWGVVEGWTEAP